MNSKLLRVAAALLCLWPALVRADFAPARGLQPGAPADTLLVGGTPLSTALASAAYMPAPSGNAATDAANFSAAQAKAARRIVFQSGTYLVPPTGYPALKSGQDIEGQGADRTILRLTAQGTYDNGMLYALEQSDIGIRRLTLDYAGFREPVSRAGVLVFRNGARVRAEDVNLTGYPRFGFVVNGGSDIRYDRGQILRAAAPLDASGVAIAKGQINQCVLVSESAAPVNRATFADVTCQGSAFDVSGADVDYLRTKVVGFDFGFAYVTEQGANSVRHRFLNVSATGGRSNPSTGMDSNNTAAGCIEIWSPDSVVDGADCSDMGGDGVSNGGKRSRILNSRFSGLGKQVAANGIVSRYELSGAFSADGSLVAGNAVVNSNGSGDGSNLVAPYYDQALPDDLRVRLVGNDFGAAAMSRKAPNASWSAPGMLISATSGAYTHTPGSIRAPVVTTVVGARRKTDTVQGVAFVATDGSQLPAGLRAFAEISADNSVTWYTQDISGGSSNISMPAGTFTGRIVGMQ